MQAGFEVSNLMNNEMAKAHGRYMCGGHPPTGTALSEVLCVAIILHAFCFQFPIDVGSTIFSLSLLLLAAVFSSCTNKHVNTRTRNIEKSTPNPTYSDPKQQQQQQQKQCVDH
jgi:hypothetical protein